MESLRKKDQNPYIVFPCNKCGQYSFVKEIQKTKRCIRCGHKNFMSKVPGEIVKGTFAAKDMVIKKQNEFAIKKDGKLPDLISESGFSVASSKKPLVTLKTQKKKKLIEEEDYTMPFQKAIAKISKEFSTCPRYFIEYMAEDFNIPGEEVKILINRFKNKGMLQEVKGKYFKILN